MKRARLVLLRSGVAAGLLATLAWGCSGKEPAGTGEPLARVESAATVPPPSPFAGNSNYWITAADPTGNTGAPITGLDVSIAVTRDLHIANGMSVQLNGWSAPTSNVVWQQYGFSITPPSLGWGIENWPTDAYGASLGMPKGGSLNFPGSLAPPLPDVPYGAGIIPAGYIFDLIFHDDASGNITGMSYGVTDICGHVSTIGPVNIVGTSMAPSGASGTIPASALAPMYGMQMNLVNMPGNPFVITGGEGTISYRASTPLYVSNHQPSWTSAQGIVTAETSDIGYSQLPVGPTKIIVQKFGKSECQCDTTGGATCTVPSGSYAGSCTGCTSTPSGSGCLLQCASCGKIDGSQNPNPSLQIPCAGSLTNASIANDNGSLTLQCTYAPSGDAGLESSIDAGCKATDCVTPQGPYLGSCTGCAAVSSGAGCVLGCTSCTKTDGSENGSPSLPLPCNATIENDDGALACGADAGAPGHDGGGGGQDASIPVKDAGSSGSGSGSGGSSGGGASSGSGGGGNGDTGSSGGCSASEASRGTSSPTQAFAVLSFAAMALLGRRRKRVR